VNPLFAAGRKIFCVVLGVLVMGGKIWGLPDGVKTRRMICKTA
jgi:hypothetical protein